MFLQQQFQSNTLNQRESAAFQLRNRSTDVCFWRARAKAALSSGCKSQTANLQPKATGAAMEVTKWLAYARELLQPYTLDEFEGRPRTIVRMTPAGVAEPERYSNIAAPRGNARADQLEVT